MKTKIRQQLAHRKRRLQRRLDKSNLQGCHDPMFTARDLHYEIADRARGLSSGGIGTMHALARQVGLIDALDQGLHLLKFHFPYHESDHVLTFAYNALCDGTCLQDLELRRQDEVFLDALGARRLPDPTTAGDFCRRFTAASIHQLQDIVHDVRVGVWAQQPAAFFAQARIDMDGCLIETTGQCKQGMDIAHDGTWGYHALVLTLANTGEVLGLVNRSANRPSAAGAAAEVDRALAVCFRGGFQQVLLRGDTKFSQTEHLDRWTADRRVQFLFGYEAKPNVQALAECLPDRAWRPLQRPPRYEVKTQPRQRPDHVKEARLQALAAELEVAESRIKVAQADVARLDALIGYATIRAPFNGTITKRWVDRGSTIKDAGTPLLTIVNASTVRVLLDIPERDVPLVNATEQNPNADGLGDRVTLRFASLRDQVSDGEFRGHITRLAAALDVTTRTMRAEVHLDNQAGHLRPNMYGQATLYLEQRSNRLLIPSTALVRRGSDVEVFYVQEQELSGTPLRGVVKLARVELGLDDGQRVEIRSGLPANVRVIARSSSIIREGDTIIPVPLQERD